MIQNSYKTVTPYIFVLLRLYGCGESDWRGPSRSEETLEAVLTRESNLLTPIAGQNAISLRENYKRARKLV